MAYKNANLELANLIDRAWVTEQLRDSYPYLALARERGLDYGARTHPIRFVCAAPA